MRGRLAGVILAAGAGRRFGRAKALAVIDGERFVERAVRLARDGGCDPAIVVLGAAAAEVVEVADLAGATLVVAADWADGLSASLRAGLGAAEAGDAAAVVLILVDQPWVGAAAIGRLQQAWERGAVAAVATYDGEPRNPVLLDRSVWPAVVVSATGELGARAWLRSHPAEVVAVDCGGTGHPADVDVPSDLP
jgi:CTP:molybdopterin cytidylyltransferase MocA